MIKQLSRLTKSLLQTAKEMFEGNILDEKEYKKITMRHLKKENLPKIDPITSEEIRHRR